MNGLPDHIAIVMDGNGRWAKQRQLSRIAGHKAGIDALRETVDVCCQVGIKIVSLYAFSSENWSRPAVEVKGLMSLFSNVLGQEVKSLHNKGIRLRFIGNKSKFSLSLQKQMQAAEWLTSKNQALTLLVAMDYGGRWDIVQACQRIISDVQQGVLRGQDLDETLFAEYLSLAHYPAPDLLIRTSGEQRLSNFFLWDLAYTELYFTPTLWPDFRKEALLDALSFYHHRERRFGRISEQLEQKIYA